jgi:hypothetical protein
MSSNLFRLTAPLRAAFFLALLMIIAVDSSASAQQNIAHRVMTDSFKVWTNSVIGNKPVLVFSDPTHECDHARVSPDRKHIVFTRYHLGFPSLEANGYTQTEAIMCAIDGSTCTTLIAPRAGVVAANSEWTPDGTGIIYASNQTPNNGPWGIRQLTIANLRSVLLLATPMMFLADPQEVGTVMALTGEPVMGSLPNSVYTWNFATQTWTAITTPTMGDYDPKLFPDGTHLTAMRQIGSSEWHIIVVANGVLTDLSAAGSVDAVPEPSGDSTHLIFYHIDLNSMINTGLWTMAIDGSDRRMIPLTMGPFYTMPAYWPGSTTQIIYSSNG